MKLRLMMAFVTAGGFDINDTDRVPTVLDTAKQLGDLDVEAEVEAELASLVAVALATTASTLSPVITTTHHARQHATERALAHLLAGVEPALVEQYGAELRSRFGSAVGVESVLRYAERIVTANPLDDAVNDMRRAGLSPSRNDNRLELVVYQVQQDSAVQKAWGEAGSDVARSVKSISIAVYETRAAWQRTAPLTR
jgi:hypothetical protein